MGVVVKVFGIAVFVHLRGRDVGWKVPVATEITQVMAGTECGITSWR